MVNAATRVSPSVESKVSDQSGSSHSDNNVTYPYQRAESSQPNMHEEQKSSEQIELETHLNVIKDKKSNSEIQTALKKLAVYALDRQYHQAI